MEWFAFLMILAVITLLMNGHKFVICDLLLSIMKDKQLTRPNILLILADDLGYGDLFSYGHPIQEEGYIDTLAARGIRFTQWYAADSLCSPSRAALLTGRLPVRVGIYPDELDIRRVFVPMDSGGLPQQETTIAELLQQAGYTTGFVGKWHLGINSKSSTDGAHLPHQHGFEFVGTNLPFTNVMSCDESAKLMESADPRQCFLYYNDTIMQQPIDLDHLSQRLVNDSKHFVTTTSKLTTRNSSGEDRPFFLYLALPHTHSSMWASAPFKGHSRRGLYGDNVNEMHWVVSEVVGALSEEVRHNTLIIFTSDNGPWLEGCLEGGSAGLLKGGKSTSYEGGIRVPGIISWPAAIPPAAHSVRVSHRVVSSLDVFTTLAEVAGVRPSSDHVLDGVSLLDTLILPAADTDTGYCDSTSTEPACHASPTRLIHYYCADRLMAVRWQRYKAHYFMHNLPTDADIAAQCLNGLPLKDLNRAMPCYDPSLVTRHHPVPLLYDLEADPGEMYPLDPGEHRETLDMMQELVNAHRESVVKGSAQISRWSARESLVPCANPPMCRLNYPAANE